ncbi:related to serine/threonine kinase ARK1 [Serendipita indica DSM 11827]|uniref:non-specific serine/threonine protein kinase n=1 Tax=Serendipita indica (strain DSM 11827) TaxID=1109443 RepID=G4T8X8_SERID|nr:related to serine/threonine kinase ARK1 [Serendipita indica DSM 11827]
MLTSGGFAHVYLVKSATPVNGTQHHVLKRMLVADHVMLQDVKKEVDIMRILRGHPNIVNLIDSAWNQLPDGRFEVFILMEFCAGGGIIDMMNRRLRERLTEGEILQIFVDVENILQANETSFKLCDFGSATSVTKAPTTAAEMRALEYDLNRHTTLQYRAPEMVDPQLRRPIDEKSDVWALGVLLYKLCYYTTPFEEHGPLAILNVQYKLPPYPVYSSGMISLITSILREYGTQRPSVFEILDTVHRMRGTKSRYRYAPRPVAAQSPIPKSPDDIVSFRVSQTQKDLKSPLVSSAAQIRQGVMEAIAPMRRGRPNALTSNTPAGGMYADDLDLPTPRNAHFKSATTSEKWNPPAREAPAVLGGSNRTVHQRLQSQEWIPSRATKEPSKPQASPWDGLGSLDATEKAQAAQAGGFGDSFDPAIMAARRNLQNIAATSPPASSSSGSTTQQPSPFQPITSPPASGTQQSRFTMPTPSRLLQAPRPPMQTKPKDSFDDIPNLSMSAPTASILRPSSNASTQNGLVSAFSRPSTAAESIASTGTGLSSAAVVEGSAALSAAERFPSIEQLEFGGREKPAPPVGPRAPSPIKPSMYSQNRPPAYSQLSRMSYTGGLALDHDIITPPAGAPVSGVRSQQVTGTAMKGANVATPSAAASNTQTNANPPPTSKPPAFSHTPATPTKFPPTERPPSRFPTAERPIAPGRKGVLARRRQASMEIKAEPSPLARAPQEQDLLGQSLLSINQPLVTQRTPSPSAVPQRDWLMDEDIVLNNIPKASTGSLQPRLPTPEPSFVDPNKAKRATMGTALISNGRVPPGAPPGMETILANWQRGGITNPSTYQPANMQPTSSSSSTSGVALPGLVGKPGGDPRPPLTRMRSNTASRIMPGEQSPPLLPSRMTTQQQQQQQPQQRRLPSPQPENRPTLTENWSPVDQQFPPRAKSTFGETQTGADSSGNEDGPEDVESTTLRQMRARVHIRDSEAASSNQKAQEVETQRQHQARQGSVHDLIDVWSTNSRATGSSGKESLSQQLEHQRLPSRDLMSFQEPVQSTNMTNQQAAAAAMSRAMQLFPPLESLDRRQSPASASGSEKDVDAARPQPQKRNSGPKVRPAQLPFERARPQSLFIAPAPSSAPLHHMRNSPQDSLPVPSPSSSSPFDRQRSGRRGSISDMVSKYEALSVVSSGSGYTASNESGPMSPRPKPPVGAKPAPLRPGGVPPSASSSPVARKLPVLKTPTANVASPGNAFLPPIDPVALHQQQQQHREPKMSAPVKMRTSPLLFKPAEFPNEPTQPPYSNYAKERESPVESQRAGGSVSGLSSNFNYSSTHGTNLQPPVTAERDRSGSPASQTGTVSDANDDILLVSPRPRQTPQQSFSDNRSQSSVSQLQREKSPPPPSESPEQVYKGVGGLIDKWQKMSEEGEGKARVGIRPGGPRQQRKGNT